MVLPALSVWLEHKGSYFILLFLLNFLLTSNKSLWAQQGSTAAVHKKATCGQLFRHLLYCVWSEWAWLECSLLSGKHLHAYMSCACTSQAILVFISVPMFNRLRFWRAPIVSCCARQNDLLSEWVNKNDIIVTDHSQRQTPCIKIGLEVAAYQQFSKSAVARCLRRQCVLVVDLVMSFTQLYLALLGVYAHLHTPMCVCTNPYVVSKAVPWAHYSSWWIVFRLGRKGGSGLSAWGCFRPYENWESKAFQSFIHFPRSLMMALNYANIIHHKTPAAKLLGHWDNIWKALFLIVCAFVRMCLREFLLVYACCSTSRFFFQMRVCVFPRELLYTLFVVLFRQKFMSIKKNI